MRSDGVLIDLRHINDVGNRDKLFQRFSVKLEDHMQTINCYVSCDEIAGTLQEVVVRPDIPASRFPKPKSSIYVANFEVNETGFDGGDLMDQDLLDLELQDYIPIENFARATGDDRTNPVQESPMHQRKNLTQSATRNSIVALRVSSEIPKKLADGKFACNHTCKDKSAYVFALGYPEALMYTDCR